jgi:hypothetical protein
MLYIYGLDSKQTTGATGSSPGFIEDKFGQVLSAISFVCVFGVCVCVCVCVTFACVCHMLVCVCESFGTCTCTWDLRIIGQMMFAASAN